MTGSYVSADHRGSPWPDDDPLAAAAGYHRDVHPSLPDLPRFALLDGPSPLAPLRRLSATLGGRAELWIKREDLLPLAFGGNKLRNLEFLVGAALAEGADTLVTVGRSWSNHCRLTAAAGARARLAVHLVLSGPPTEPPNPGRRLDELLGATVHQTATADRAERDARVEQVVEELRAAGHRPYLIGVGGSGALGAVGQVRAAWELLDQAAERGLGIDALVVPSATGGTQAGLLAGLRTAGSSTAVLGVAVARPPDELRAAMALILHGLQAYTGALVNPTELEIAADQFGSGYGVPTQEAEEAGRLLARTEGILVDPIYTAKALAALVARVQAGRFDGRTVVFWHAGGLPGLFEQLAADVTAGSA